MDSDTTVRKRPHSKAFMRFKQRKVDRDQMYAHMKAQLPSDLTPQQYEQACRRIADLLGI
jgi:hypothetical protein